MKTTISIALALGGVLASYQPASAKSCSNSDGSVRWANGLSQCAVAASFCYYGQSLPLSQGQQRTLYYYQFSDTPEEACRKLVEKVPYISDAQRASWKLVNFQNVDDPTDYQCTYDYNGDGTVRGIAAGPYGWIVAPTSTFYDDFSGFHPMINPAIIQTEPMCDRIPNGPNKNVSFATSPVTGPGRTFTDTQTKLVKANTATSVPGTYYSQAYQLNGMQLDYWQLVADPKWAMGNIPPDQSPQVDHIIPRVDIHGCACGPNSPANSLVISAKLNREMSNLSENEKRQFLLGLYTLAPRSAAQAPAPDESGGSAEIDDAMEGETANIGGCAAGGGAPGGAAVLAMTAFLALRRRSGRSNEQ